MQRCLIGLILVGCPRAAEPSLTEVPPRVVDSGTPEVVVVDSATTDTAPTGPTEPEVDPDCLVPPPSGPFQVASTSVLRTEEDFDFDIDGFLISQANRDLQGMNRQGDPHIVAPGIGVDAAGIRSLSTGDVVVAQPDTGSLRLVNYNTGGSSVCLGGLTFPNGLEATSEGLIFSSEYRDNGRIRLVDPYSGQSEVVGQLSYPNNMALSPDETALYVVVMNQVGNGAVAVLRKDESGEWGAPEPFYVHTTMLGGITTDKCGNVYVVEYTGGRLVRLAPDTGTPEVLADLGSSSFSSLRFGHGLGGWERTELFATNRARIYVVDVGIEGRHVLAAPEE